MAAVGDCASRGLLSNRQRGLCQAFSPLVRQSVSQSVTVTVTVSRKQPAISDGDGDGDDVVRRAKRPWQWAALGGSKRACSVSVVDTIRGSGDVLDLDVDKRTSVVVATRN